MDGSLIKLVTGSRSPLLMLLLFLVLSSTKCDEEKNPEFVFMSFQIPISIQPYKEVFHVGDTLWLQGSFPDTLFEIHTSKYYKFIDFDFKSKICVSELINNQLYVSQQPAAFNNFEVVNQTGSTSQISSICGTFNFIYYHENYLYKIGFVTTTQGVFNIIFLMPVDLHGLPEEQLDLKPIINLGTTTDGRKRIPIYEALLFTINQGNTNYRLFTEYCKPGTATFAETNGSFTFRVIE